MSRILPSQTQVPQTQISQAETTQTAQTSSSSSADSASAGKGTPYPANVVQNFMNACMQSGGNQEACSCVLNKTQDRYTLQEYAQVETTYKETGKMPQEMTDFVVACRPQKSQQ